MHSDGGPLKVVLCERKVRYTVCVGISSGESNLLAKEVLWLCQSIRRDTVIVANFLCQLRWRNRDSARPRSFIEIRNQSEVDSCLDDDENVNETGAR